MTPEERIDAALDSVLREAGSALKNYTTKITLNRLRMREAMRKVMADSYIAGSNAHFEATKKARWKGQKQDVAPSGAKIGSSEHTGFP